MKIWSKFTARAYTPVHQMHNHALLSIPVYMYTREHAKLKKTLDDWGGTKITSYDSLLLS